jgi:hypothetical protein
MKLQALAVLALAFGATTASAAELLDVSDVAARTGLTERQVRMALGAPTTYAEYRTSYRIAEHKVKQLLGERQFRELAESYQRANAKVIAAR